MTLTEFEASLLDAPSYARQAAGPAYALRQRLASGETWTDELLASVADGHRQALARARQEDEFRRLTGP
jgi:hypothetical protein